ncbi:heme-dependent oxidative N-demethylase family protein [Iningainema tapete]|uniref:DUF3445 domain-containing protein n=1 Tax=Iningainema tapete BLCC-T55 TaxID=2748662 RepID=A0A8J7BWE5_9CYAN|nr:DUF3445 domain-containing protein [Iningainema tapete]MBD2770808.1 DUF3445 domain-containing protein [Iningainema tapete BLCC-T55]
MTDSPVATSLTEIKLQQAKTVEASHNCAYYFPLENGRYDVKPGLIRFGSCFGNGDADKMVFQFDENFAHYREVKLLARAERLNKYYLTNNYSDPVAGAVAHLIINRLTQEHPQYFQYDRDNNNKAFHSQLTKETLYFNADWQLQQVATQTNQIVPPLISTLDALATQVQEDITVVCRSGCANWLSAIHLCYPNHWSAEEKIGKDFATIHAPVAGMEKINQRGSAIINTMIERKPMVRFAWGLSTDTRLNHHPKPPREVPVNEWQGRNFDLNNPRLFLRIERQVIWGLPEYNAGMFTIRTYFRDCSIIKQDHMLRSQLCSAIQSMTKESLVYKGLAESRDDILTWLL